MKLAIFADRDKRDILEPILGSVAEQPHVFYDCYDNFIQELPHSRCDAVLIAQKGAAGMQSVRAAKILLHRVPVVWLSDDSGFVEESYRTGCAFFSAEEITEKLINSALARCRSERSNLQ